MTLVFPNIVRYTIVGSVGLEDCMNILDADLRDPGGAIGTREDWIEQIAGDLLNQWNDHILPLVSVNYTAREVRWVDLNSATGTTGSRTSTDGATWPATGGNPGAALPNNTYAKVVKTLEGKNRTERNGVLRLGGIPESSTITTAPNTLEAQVITEINAGFEQLKDGINEGVFDFSVNLGMLHTRNAVATGFSEIAQFSCAPTVGTLRRRMPGYGS